MSRWYVTHQTVQNRLLGLTCSKVDRITNFLRELNAKDGLYPLMYWRDDGTPVDGESRNPDLPVGKFFI